jgi:DNA processing protein
MNSEKIVLFSDEEYPSQLKEITNPPKQLNCIGNIELLKEKNIIAIIGSREANEEAINKTYELARELSGKGYVIVSGGAKGIDAAAHKGALENGGKTIAILGSGFKHMYPEENIKLFKKISEKGLLISEYDENFLGSKYSYLDRNRITSGLSNGIIIMAGSYKGGSISQINLAHKQKKVIMYPNDMKIYPNEGFEIVKEKYNGRKISNVEDIIEYIKEKKIQSIINYF